MSSADDFRSAVERGDLEGAAVLFSPEIVFHSPVTFHPFVGRETVSRLLAEVAQVFEDFRYTDELHADGAHGLIFRASVAGKEVEGMDLLRIDADGLIDDFTVIVRPLSGLIALAQAMGERAAAAGLETTRS
jgi:hypothetical protein